MLPLFFAILPSLFLAAVLVVSFFSPLLVAFPSWYSSTALSFFVFGGGQQFPFISLLRTRLLGGEGFSENFRGERTGVFSKMTRAK